jgi:Lhr-like helicase
VEALRQQNQLLAGQNELLESSVSQMANRTLSLKRRVDDVQEQSRQQDARIQDLLESLEVCRAENSDLRAKRRKLSKTRAFVIEKAREFDASGEAHEQKLAQA